MENKEFLFEILAVSYRKTDSSRYEKLDVVNLQLNRRAIMALRACLLEDYLASSPVIDNETLMSWLNKLYGVKLFRDTMVPKTKTSCND